MNSSNLEVNKIPTEINKDFLNFLGRCIKMDKYAWDTFIETYSNMIYQYILRTFKRYSYTIQNNEVDETLNSIFLALLDGNCRRLRNFRGQNERSFSAYLREISFHTTIDLLRKKRSFIDLEKIQHCLSTKNDYENLDYRYFEKIILALREELPQRYNYLFKLIYDEELDFSEIAEILNIKLNALHQLKFRMIKKIIKISKEKDLYNELKIFMNNLCGIGIKTDCAISMN